MSNVTTCTFTGVDVYTPLQELSNLSAQYPFVEWGILYSPKRQGEPGRYMTHDKIYHDLCLLPTHVRVALHICGQGVPNLIDDEPEVCKLVKLIEQRGGRVQLNFNQLRAHFSLDEVSVCIRKYPTIEFITQSNTANANVWGELSGCKNHTILFDSSGGNGKSPVSWEHPKPGTIAAYAGGLGPDNLAEQLNILDSITYGEPYRIDMEGKIRDSEDRFDLNAVKMCLGIIEKRNDK